jgi:hypothetical protein
MNPAHFELTTIWIRNRRRLLEVAYGGALLTPRRQAGISLLVIKPSVGLPEGGSGFYALPRASRRVTLTCVRGDIISVRYPGGGRGTFNLRTHAWRLQS